MPKDKAETAEQLFRRAGGKNLAKDRQKTHSRVVESKKKYIKVGAKKSDLSGLDTESGKFVSAREPSRRPTKKRPELRSSYIEDFEDRIVDIYGYFERGLSRTELSMIRDRESMEVMTERSFSGDATLQNLNSASDEVNTALWRSPLMQDLVERNGGNIPQRGR